MRSKKPVPQTTSAFSQMAQNGGAAREANEKHDTRAHDTSLNDRIAEAAAKQSFKL